jgi:signal transduction histidine kinase
MVEGGRLSEAHDSADGPPLAETQRLLAATDALLACYRRAIGHDLPNRFVAIRGFLQLLEKEQSEHLTEDGRDCLRRLRGSAQQAQEMVQMLAELGRVSPEPPPAQPTDLAEVAQEAAAEVGQLFPGRTIQYDFPQTPVALPLVRPKVRRVLVQLFKNAVQAVPGDGPVHIQVGGQVGKTGAGFSVADNGGGMTPEFAARLRDFFAGRHCLNCGLGLALVRQIVVSWGGQLDVQSTPGKGSLFSVSLPAC